MAITTISNLWTPDIWIDAMREQQATFPVLMNSGAVVKSPTFDGIASGAGASANIPFWKDITDQADEIQVEDTAPTTNNGITSGTMVTPILNRVTKNIATALAAAVSGGDPVAEITSQMAQRRLKQRQTTLISMLGGLFGVAAAPDAATGCIRANRYDKFSETGASPSTTNTFDYDMFINGKALLGELSDSLRNGAMFVHSAILAGLQKLDQTSFKEKSMGAFTIQTYRDVPLFVSDSLVRAGGTSGYVYYTYLLAAGAIAYGEKAQAGDVVDAASLQYYADKDKNNEYIWDRTRFAAHLLGTKWVGTASGQSATNAELATAGNWNLVFSSAARIPAVLIRTNA